MDEDNQLSLGWIQSLGSREEDILNKSKDEGLIWVGKITHFSEVDSRRLINYVIDGLWDSAVSENDKIYSENVMQILRNMQIEDYQTFLDVFANFTVEVWPKLTKQRHVTFSRFFQVQLNCLLDWLVQYNCPDSFIRFYKALSSAGYRPGLQSLFIDLAADKLKTTIQDFPQYATKILIPLFSDFLIADPKEPVATHLYLKLIKPLLESNGESFFGSNHEGSLDFVVKLSDLLQKTKIDKKSNRHSKDNKEMIFYLCRKALISLRSNRQLGQIEDKSSDVL